MTTPTTLAPSTQADRLWKGRDKDPLVKGLEKMYVRRRDVDRKWRRRVEPVSKLSANERILAQAMPRICLKIARILFIVSAQTRRTNDISNVSLLLEGRFRTAWKRSVSTCLLIPLLGDPQQKHKTTS